MHQLGNTIPAQFRSAGCAASSSQHTEAIEADDDYTCPMHPEVTGKQGDKCPKCGMDLTHK